MKRLILVLLLLPVFLLNCGFASVQDNSQNQNQDNSQNNVDSAEKKDFIKWIDFNVTKEVLAAAQKKHKEFVKQGVTDIGTCEILSYLAVKNGNRFTRRDIARIKKLSPGALKGLTDNRYYNYYAESYHAVLDGIINSKSGETVGFFPLADGYWYRHYDDFGTSRGYGYQRRHLGNDIFGSIGAPIIAVEGGTVTELGWNRYGGWRVGIRSDDTKRYYYYAHLRKGRPFAKRLKLGDKVEAGEVIAYLGVTGYSRREDTNMKTTEPHLHFGIQIIFDKSQEHGATELWIDVYELNKFLARKKSRTVKNPVTKEHESVRSKNYIFEMTRSNFLKDLRFLN